MRSIIKRSLEGVVVAKLPIETSIGMSLMHCGRFRRQGKFEINRGRKRLDLKINQLKRIPGGRFVFGDDHGQDLTQMANTMARDQRSWRRKEEQGVLLSGNPQRCSP